MNTALVRPLPETTYQLLLDAARTWPDGIAMERIPTPATTPGP